MTSSRARLRRPLSAALSCALGILLLVPGAAVASISHPNVVSENPANFTPNVEGSGAAVHALHQIGGTMYAGGVFATVSNANRTSDVLTLQPHGLQRDDRGVDELRAEHQRCRLGARVERLVAVCRRLLHDRQRRPAARPGQARRDDRSRGPGVQRQLRLGPRHRAASRQRATDRRRVLPSALDRPGPHHRCRHRLHRRRDQRNRGRQRRPDRHLSLRGRPRRQPARRDRQLHDGRRPGPQPGVHADPGDHRLAQRLVLRAVDPAVPRCRPARLPA